MLLSIVLMLSLCVTAFAEGNEDGQANQGEAVCQQLEGCTEDTHAEGCPLYVTPKTPDEGDEQEQTPSPATCIKSPGCTAAEHETDCPLYVAPCTKNTTCAAASHEAGCPNDPTVKAVQALIDGLDANAVTADNIAAVVGQIKNIATEKANLTSEQQAALNLANYTAMASPMINALPDTDAITQSNVETVTAQLAAIDATGASLSEADQAKYDAAKTAVEKISANGNTPTEPTPVEKVQLMINALPETVTAGNAEDVKSQLAAIDTAKAALSDEELESLDITKEELESLDITKYVAAANALGSYYENMTLESVAQIGEQFFSTVEEAINAASAGDIITLLKDADISSVIIRKNITLDLNTHTLNLVGNSAPDEKFYGLAVIAGTTRVTNGAVIDKRTGDPSVGDRVAFAIQASGVLSTDNVTITSYRPYENTNKYNYILQGNYGGEIILNSGTVVQDKYVDSSTYATWGCVGVSIYGTTDAISKLTINGAKVDTMGFAVSGNGTAHNTEITITGSSELISDSQAIYHPQAGTLNVQSGTITGTTGIEMRAGTLNVTGGTITGTGTPTSVTPNGNGSTSDGAGIAVAQHTTKLPIIVNISGGNIFGYSALYESNPQKNDASSIEKIQISITGGGFQAINGGTSAIYSEDKTGFIRGGTYSSDVSAYVVEGNKAIKNQNDSFTIGPDPAVAVAEVDGVGYTSVQAAINAAATAGNGEVKLLNNTSEDVVIPTGADITLNLADGVTLTNSQNHTITNNGTLTIVGSGRVDNVTHARAALVNNEGATAYLKGGTLTRSAEASTSSTDNGGNSYYVIDNRGSMEIDGANIINTGYYSSLIRNMGTTSQNANLEIKSGSITQEHFIAVKNDEYSQLSVTGGTITSQEQAIQNWTTADISGGTLNGNVITWSYSGSPSTTNISDSAVINGNVIAVNYDNSTDIPTVNISGGTVKGELKKGLYNKGIQYQEPNVASSDINISGGTFSSEVAEEYCADGYYPNKNADGTYSVHEHNYGEPVFTWTGTDSCTVTISCKTCGDALTQPCTVTKTTIPATATEAEKTVYTATATINGESVTTTKTVNGLAILAGQDQTYALYSGEGITIRCSGALNDFVSVSVDGKTVASSNYTVKSGSTVLTFSSTYLNTLSVGDHTVTMNYKPGVYMTDSVSTALTVTAGWEKLEIEVKANRSSVRPGKTITYTLTITNNTGTDLTDIVISNTVDKNLVFSSSSGTGTYAAKDGLWTVSELKNGKSAKITLKFTVKSDVKDGTKLNYTAAITDADAENGESLPGSVKPSDSVTVKVSNKLSIIPGTGDTSNIGLWITILSVTLVVLIAVGVIAYIKSRKKK